MYFSLLEITENGFWRLNLFQQSYRIIHGRKFFNQTFYGMLNDSVDLCSEMFLQGLKYLEPFCKFRNQH